MTSKTSLVDLLQESNSDRVPNADGITRLTASPSVVYDPWLDLSSMEKLRDSLKRSVSYAIDEHTETLNGATATRANMYELSRGAWQALCPMRGDSIVLDFGSGLGAVTRSLARNAGFVVGMDACYERLMVNAAVNRELGVSNIQLAFGNDKSLSEFRDKSIDGVALNGVLEWVPESVPGNPRKVQRDFLRDIRRILKPDGWLYVGIENRCGFRYFLGRPDDHVNLLFSSLMPRWLASIYSKCVRGRDYRTYTYTPRGMAKLLNESGFKHVNIYMPTPDYRHFHLLMSPSGDSRIADVGGRLGITKPWKKRIVESRAFTRLLMPSLGVVATPEVLRSPAWLDDLQESSTSSVSHAYTKYDQASFWYRGEDRPWRIRDLALSEGASVKLRRITTVAEAVRQHPECPKFLRGWQLNEQAGFVWSDRTCVQGQAFRDIPTEERESKMQEVFVALRHIHRLGSELNVEVQGISAIFEDYAPNAEAELPAHLMSQIRSLNQELERDCNTTILMHGDCNPGNVLVTENGAQLIDWEWSRVVNFPGYDVLKLAWYGSENAQKPGYYDQNDCVEKSLSDDVAQAYLAQVHSDADWKSCVLFYWATRVARTIGQFYHSGQPFPKAWIGRVIEPTIASMHRVLGT